MAHTHTAGTGVSEPSARTGNRWLLVAGALLLQLAIGGVYAWSVIGGALGEADSWQLGKVQAALPFTVSVGMIFIGSFLGGRIQDDHGPRLVALAGGTIYAGGILLASLANGSDDYWLLIVGYGVVSGFGLGFAYIVPIAMLQKWFPDKKGLITGLAVGGFGFGAVITAPVAQWLIDRDPQDPTSAFLPLGLAYLVMALAGASVFRNPPEGYTVPGHEPPAATATGDGSGDYSTSEALRTPQWYLLTAILTLSVSAGISLISQAKASATDIAGFSVTGAAAVVGVLAIFNGAGRIVWAGISDRIGRMRTFAAILVLQGVCLIALPHAGSALLFTVLAAIIYLCYGGAFGTMPATAGDYFGLRDAGAIYGLMLIGWSLGGILGPVVASALIGEDKAYTVAYTTIGVIALASVALTFVTKVPAGRRAGDAGHA
ncbi:OFA family MFS transporter [Nocardioides sp. S-58]|uniref:OFA family MFS transporter n=1 Tax=Nocardioides renjunii TaxID=3095075 RepID=A0ABU5K915_9ACTN|nr:OFA family MFS transporter [Nocardioides sp. S-58]MDZ5661454.1 OFA family MFS transporter [Nocardioides sp. S-58]